MSKRQKALLEVTLVVFILAMVFMAWAATISAEAAPNTQHWHLPINDDAWLITEPGCNLQTTQYGGSYHFECVEDAKGE